MSVSVTSKSAVGELYILPASPWSKRVLLAQSFLRSQVQIKKYRPIFTEWYIRIRAGWPKHIITAPAMFTPTGKLVCESHDIARLLDAARAPNRCTLFPTRHDEQLRVLVRCAEDISIHARSKMMQSFADNPRLIARMMLPKWVAELPGIPTIFGFVSRNSMKKYEEVSATASEVKTRECLDIIRKSLRNGRSEFLISDTLTYADIVVSGALALLISEDKTSKIGKPPAQFTQLGEEYADVKKWGDQFLAKYVTEEAVRFPPSKYDAEGNVIS